MAKWDALWTRLLRRRDENRFRRFNIVVAILLAGWVPSIAMLVISYTILTNTLESRILRDRTEFVKLVAHLVGDDLTRTGVIIEFYQWQPDVANVLTSPQPAAAAQQWVDQTFYSHPRIDGMFLAGPDGRLLGAVPSVDSSLELQLLSESDRQKLDSTAAPYVTAVRPRPPDLRMASYIVGAVRARDDNRLLGYVGVAMLVERMGKRLALVDIPDQQIYQVIDQEGHALLGPKFQTNNVPATPEAAALFRDIAGVQTGHLDRHDNLYSFAPIENTGWSTIIEQSKAVAYQPVHDLLRRITLPVLWLILLTAIGAWLAGRFTRRQNEAARRIEREVIFNEKILANMPSGIALLDPVTRKFLQANEAFRRMAHSFGGFPDRKEIYDAPSDEVQIAPVEAVEKVLTFGTPYQLIEQPFNDRRGVTHFVNVNLLRLQGAEQRIQGVLYLVEDKTRDVTLRQELIGANAAKDQFLALLSHELRNPLSPVIAMVGELEASTVSEKPEVRGALEVIRRNVELEARLIDDLLDVTRISKGKLQLTFETVSVHEILQRAFEICRGDILEKNLRIEFRFRAEQAHVEGDSARLQQVFWNLIKNSVKFTPEQGRIIVETFNPAADQIEIRTTDTGIGIEPEKIAKIFNAFEQGQNSITRRFGGLGLGLAISKAMVAAHGGTISVQSDGRDRGSTFVVTLHTVPTPAADSPETKGGPPEITEDAKARMKQTAPRLLVVDDHHDTCTGMKMMLERRGYRVSVAHSADEAAAKANEEDFDLLVSDIGLPDRSGYELMEELRTRKGLRGIALSGFGMENDVARAREAGFSEHLTKPINFERLEEVIHSLLATQPAEPTRGA